MFPNLGDRTAVARPVYRPDRRHDYAPDWPQGPDRVLSPGALTGCDTATSLADLTNNVFMIKGIFVFQDQVFDAGSALKTPSEQRKQSRSAILAAC